MMKQVYGSLELIVNICFLGKMRIAALSIENLLFKHSSAALEFFISILGWCCFWSKCQLLPSVSLNLQTSTGGDEPRHYDHPVSES